MPYASAQTMEPDTIPVVDLRPLRDGSAHDQVAAALHSASQNLGFIYVSGHGISPSLIEAARNAAYRFFRSSNDEKHKVLITPRHRGWLKPGTSKMEDDAKVDLKESFIWGFEDTSGFTPEDHPLRGGNQWPDNIPDMRTIAMQYFAAAHEVAHHLMRGFATGLGLEKEFFLTNCTQPLSRASFVYYPAQDEHCGIEQFGVAPHTDFGVMTVLCQDNTGGLQVQDINGRWLHAPPVDGSLVVNVGDLLSRWTGGAYKSTPHRVVNTSGKERLSLVLAFDPNPDTLIDARTTGIALKESLLPPITCGDYLIERFAKAFSYRKPSAGE